MTRPDPFETLRRTVADIRPCKAVGRITAISSAGLSISGLSMDAALGDDLLYGDDGGRAEVVGLGSDGIQAVPLDGAKGLRIGALVEHVGPASIAPDDGWIGRVIDPLGRPLDGRRLPVGASRSLTAAPPPAARRRPMGSRLHTGYAVLDTMLPLARGQRIGLFAGSGVGKSTLLGGLARRVEADVCVLALIGERGREVADFVRDVLGARGMARTVVIAATSDMPAPVRRRGALAAMSVAEHFRDAGRQVLFLCDSVTRLAEAHREVATAAGERADLRGHPASLTPILAALSERAGPGTGDQGDITAVLSVLVAGSDMEEPVADIVRGQLDGHVVLSREIAEAGRFPAVDVLRSVSRSLPGVASDAENAIIAQARSILGVHDRSALMVSSGLYERGASTEIDRAVAVSPRLDAVFTQSATADEFSGFRDLAPILGMGYSMPKPGVDRACAPSEASVPSS